MKWLRSQVAWLKSRPAAEAMLAFALGTFQTCLLVFTLIALIYLRGDLAEALSGLSTAAGLGVFVLLWLPTIYCTLRAIDEVGMSRLDKGPAAAMLVGGVKWGAINGASLIALPTIPLMLAFSGYSLVRGEFQDASIGVYAGAIFGLIAATVAGFIGSQIGVVSAVIQVLLLRVACLVAGVRGRPQQDAPAE